MARLVFILVVSVLLTAGSGYSLWSPKQHAASGATRQASAKTSKPSVRKGGSSAAKSGKSRKQSAAPRQRGRLHAAPSGHAAAAKGAKSSGRKGAAAARGRSKSAPPPVPRGQQAPAPDRVKEIQQALIQRGYLKGEPSGQWNQDSVDALRRFQEDQKMEASGKLSSLALIHLGLGPKRDTPAQQRTEQPQ